MTKKTLVLTSVLMLLTTALFAMGGADRYDAGLNPQVYSAGLNGNTFEINWLVDSRIENYYLTLKVATDTQLAFYDDVKDRSDFSDSEYFHEYRYISIPKSAFSGRREASYTYRISPSDRNLYFNYTLRGDFKESYRNESSGEMEERHAYGYTERAFPTLSPELTQRLRSEQLAAQAAAQATGETFSGSVSLANSQQVAITIGVFGDLENSFGAIFESADFKRKFPNVRIEMQSSDFGGHHNRLVAQIAAGTGANDIEALEIGYMSLFAEDGGQGMLDLSGEFSRRNMDKVGLADYAVSYATMDTGRMLAVPFDVAPAVLFYRKSMADQAGVNMDSIDSWAEFLDIAGKLSRDTDYDGQIDRWGITGPVDYEPMLLNGGYGGWFDSETPYQPKEKFMSVLALAEDMSDDRLSAGYWPWSGEWMNGFKEEEIAIMGSGYWLGFHLRNWMAPELSGDVRVALLPAGTRASSGNNYLSVPAQTRADKRDICMDIIQYISSTEAAQAILLDQEMMPVLTTLYDSPSMEKTDPYFGNQKIWKVFAEATRGIPSTTLTADDYFSHQVFNEVLDEVAEGTLTPERAYNKALGRVLAEM